MRTMAKAPTWPGKAALRLAGEPANLNLHSGLRDPNASLIASRQPADFSAHDRLKSSFPVPDPGKQDTRSRAFSDRTASILI
jgi:hypothetical protein